MSLTYYNPVVNIENAIRGCWRSENKCVVETEKDAVGRELIIRVGNKFKHKSTLEHGMFMFSVDSNVQVINKLLTNKYIVKAGKDEYIWNIRAVQELLSTKHDFKIPEVLRVHAFLVGIIPMEYRFIVYEDMKKFVSADVYKSFNKGAIDEYNIPSYIRKSSYLGKSAKNVDLKYLTPLGGAITNGIVSLHVRDISRAVLQELARHRTFSLSVEYTRYTLNKLVNEVIDKNSLTVDDICKNNYKELRGMLVMLSDMGEDNMKGRKIVDENNIRALARLVNVKRTNDVMTNDLLKYMLPEAYKTSLAITTDLKSMANFIELRDSKNALPEIRYLAQQIKELISNE